MAASVLLAGCGSMSPSRLYDRAANVFSSPPESNEPYPNLASVPPRPTPPSLAERQQVSAGLVADRNNAQYTEEVLRNPLAPPPGQLAQTPALPLPAPPPPRAPTAAEQPVAAAPPAAVPPAEAAAPPGSAPVVRLVNGQLVASPGFFATEAPQGSAPPAAVPAPVSSLQPGPVPTAAPLATASGVALNPGQPERPSPPLAAQPAPVPLQTAAAPAPAAPPSFSPDVVPEAPPPPPFELPARPSQPPPAAPAAVAALPPPALAPAPAARPQPRLAAPPTQGESARVAVIYFADGQARLGSDDEKVVDQVAQLYKLRGGTVRVLGYSGTPAQTGDIVRSSINGLNLASSRADAVAAGLARHGVPRGVIEVSASTDPPPLLESGRNTGIAGTRRAEIWLDY